ANLQHYLYVAAFAMVPIIELKGAMPVGLAFGLGTWETFAAALLGSCLPAPFLILLTRKIIAWAAASKIVFFNRIATFLLRKIERGQDSKAFRTSALLGLFVFVAIPLPTTGVWTGSMIAGMLNLRLKSALPMIILGNAVAGLIVLSMSHLLIA
ncbi:MAG: small multi-drug export protein, partial [Clostridia bacterium]